MIPLTQCECKNKCRRHHYNHPNHCNCTLVRMTQQQSIRASRLPTIVSRPATLTQQQIQQQQQRSRLPQSTARSRTTQQVMSSPTRMSAVAPCALPCRTPQQRMAEKSRGVTNDGSALPRPSSAPATRRMCSARAGPCECAPVPDSAGGGGRPLSAGSALRAPQSSSARGTRGASRAGGTLGARCNPTCNTSICEVRAVASGSSITAEASIRRPKSRTQTLSTKQQTLRSRSAAASAARSAAASSYSPGNSVYRPPGSVPSSDVYPSPSVGGTGYGGTSSSTYGGTGVGSSAYDSTGTTSVESGYGPPSVAGGTSYALPVDGKSNNPAESVDLNTYSVPNSVGGTILVNPNSVAGSGPGTVASVDGNSYAIQGNVPGSEYANPNSIGGYSVPTGVVSSVYMPNRDTSGTVYGSTVTGGVTFSPGTVTSSVGAPSGVVNASTPFTGSIGASGTSRVRSSSRVPASNAESAVSFGGVSVRGISSRQPGVPIAGSNTSFSAISGVSAGASHSGVGLSMATGKPMSVGGRSIGVPSTGPSSTFGGRETSYANRANCLSALDGLAAPTRGRSTGNLGCPTSCTAALARLGLRAGAEAGARAVAQAVARAVANVDSDAAALAAAKIAVSISPTKQRMLGESNVLGDDSMTYMPSGFNSSVHPSMPNSQQSIARGTRNPTGRYSPTMLRLQETPNANSTLADEPPWEEDIDLADALAALDIAPSPTTTNPRWTSPTSQRLYRRTEAASRGAQGARSLGEVPHARTPNSSLVSRAGEILETVAPWDLDPDLAMDLDMGEPSTDSQLLASVSAFEPRNNSTRQPQKTKRIEFQNLDDESPPWDDYNVCDDSEYCGDPLCEAALPNSSQSYSEPRRDKQHKIYPKTPLPSTVFNATITGPSISSSRDESSMYTPFINGSRLVAPPPGGFGNQGEGVGGSMMSETGMGGQRMSDSLPIGSGAAGSRIRESGLGTTGLGSKVPETGSAGSRTRESGLLEPMGTTARAEESGITNDGISNITVTSTTHINSLRTPSQALAAMAENLRRQEKHEYETLNKSLREMQQWRRELISDFQMASLAKFTKSELEMIDKVEAPSEATDGSIMDDTMEEDDVAPNEGPQTPQRDPMEEPDLIQFSPGGNLDAVQPVLSVFSRGILEQLNLL